MPTLQEPRRNGPGHNFRQVPGGRACPRPGLPGPQDVALFGNRVFADGLGEVTLDWQTWLGATGTGGRKSVGSGHWRQSGLRTP